jgi:mannose-1-phosphate guanylyltransferase
MRNQTCHLDVSTHRQFVRIFDLHGIRRVARFVEKPTRRIARELVDSGALWNTMVMIVKVRTLLQMIERIERECWLL